MLTIRVTAVFRTSIFLSLLTDIVGVRYSYIIDLFHVLEAVGKGVDSIDDELDLGVLLVVLAVPRKDNRFQKICDEQEVDFRDDLYCLTC